MRQGYHELIRRKRNARRQAAQSAEHITGWVTYLSKNSGRIARDMIEDKLFPPETMAGRIFGWIFTKERSGSFSTNVRSVGKPNRLRLCKPYHGERHKSLPGWTGQVLSLLRPLVATVVMAYARRKMSDIFSFRKKRR